MSERKTLRCDCGCAKLKTRPWYGFGKWFLLIGGGTPKPDGREVYCVECDKVLARENTSLAK